MCLLVWRKNCQGFRQFEGVSKLLSSLNHLYRAPSLFLSPPLRCSRPFPIFLVRPILITVLVLIYKKIARAPASLGGFQFFSPQGNGASGPQTCFPDTLWDAPVYAGFFLLILPLTPAFFQRRRKQESRGVSKEKSGMGRSIPEGVRTTSLGDRRAVSLRKYFLNPPKLAGALAIFL